MSVTNFTIQVSHGWNNSALYQDVKTEEWDKKLLCCRSKTSDEESSSFFRETNLMYQDDEFIPPSLSPPSLPPSPLITFSWCTQPPSLPLLLPPAVNYLYSRGSNYRLAWLTSAQHRSEPVNYIHPVNAEESPFMYRDSEGCCAYRKHPQSLLMME